MITDVPGVEVGHWTGRGTGVTVVVVPPGTTASCEVRGGAPASRDRPARAGADRRARRRDRAERRLGVRARGAPTASCTRSPSADAGTRREVARCPIVPAAAIFDLVGSEGERPGPEEGRAALRAAAPAPFALGRVGAGRGATIGKWRGGEYAVPGGLGSASARDGDVVVGALAVVNAVGDVIGVDGRIVAGSSAPEGTPGFGDPLPFEEGEHTTLVVVATNARLSKLECKLVAESAHHGMARAIHPSHSRHDGDIAFALATGQVDAHVDRLRMIASEVTAEAIRAAVR